MWLKILPEAIENQYQGRKIALWIFYVIAIMTVVRSCIHIFKYDGGAQSIATIPLDTFTQSGAGAVIFLFSVWGLNQLLMGAVYVIVAMKYKELIPLMYTLLFIEYAGRIGLVLWKPIETVGQAPGGILNLVMIPLCIIMFILSISKIGE